MDVLDFIIHIFLLVLDFIIHIFLLVSRTDSPQVTC
jgi:hypothetical protein